MSPDRVLSLRPPAKLNRFLHIIGRRADGYHLLQTAFELIDWCDELEIADRDDGIIARREAWRTCRPNRIWWFVPRADCSAWPDRIGAARSACASMCPAAPDLAVAAPMQQRCCWG